MIDVPFNHMRKSALVAIDDAYLHWLKQAFAKLDDNLLANVPDAVQRFTASCQRLFRTHRLASGIVAKSFDEPYADSHTPLSSQGGPRDEQDAVGAFPNP